MAATQAANESPSTSFGRVVQIEAGVLEVGYVDAGPADGPAVVLLHGWPYDIHSYAEVTPRLAVAGYRMIVPYLRGYGTTRFLSETKVRNGEQAALAFDTIALMDALGIETAIIAGFDWGARSADIVAALWPERVSGLVSVSGYLIGSQHAGKVPLPPQAEHQSWYQYYFATERGRAGYDQASRGPTAIPVLTPPPRRLTPAATTAKRVRAARCDRRPADARHVARDVCLIPIASARRSRCDRRPAHRTPPGVLPLRPSRWPSRGRATAAMALPAGPPPAPRARTRRTGWDKTSSFASPVTTFAVGDVSRDTSPLLNTFSMSRQFDRA